MKIAHDPQAAPPTGITELGSADLAKVSGGDKPAPPPPPIAITRPPPP